MDMSFQGLMPVWPEIFLACASMALLMYGVFRGDRSTRTVSWLSVLALAITAALVLYVTPDSPRRILSDLFILDGFRGFVKVVVLAAAAVGIVMSLAYNEREGIARFEFPVLLLLAVLGMIMMISAHDLISLYIGLELQSLALYVVAAFRRDNIKSSEAGLKYFVLGALASGMLLYGASLVYGFSGSTNFAGIAEAIAAGGPAVTGIVVGLVFLIVGLAFKVSGFPFHMWTPDVYEGAPTPVTAFFASAPKLAAMALFAAVLMGPFGGLADQWQQILWVISIGSMLVGAIAAIAQTNIKRMLAYSSIGHVGYALIGLAAGTGDGLQGILIYMAIYLVMTLGAFACVLCMRRDGRMVEDISDLAGLSKSRPGMAALLAIFMFSMAGIPPLAGFFGKLYIFLAAIDAGLYALAIIGVLSSVIAAFYYLRIVKVMYFDETERALDRDAPRDLRAIQLVAGFAVLLFFLFPQPLLRATEYAVKGLTGG